MALKTMLKKEFVKEYYNQINYYRFLTNMTAQHPESKVMLKARGYLFGSKKCYITVAQQQVFFEFMG